MYDEHGGLYDHVTPPAAVDPGDKPPGSTLFNFKRLGVRVPAVLVSPFIPKGKIIHDKVFDHTSIIATARKLFLKDPDKFFLTERDRRANTFEDCLTLSAPRQGKVTIPQPTAAPASAPLDAPTESRVAIRAGANIASSAGAMLTESTKALNDEIALASAATSTPVPPGGALNDFQATMIQHAFALDSALPAHQQTDTLVSSIQTEQDTAQYLAAIRARIEKERNGKTKQPPRGDARKTGTKAAKKKAVKVAKKSTGKAKKSAAKAAKKTAQKASK
jgi:hypothetical protein